MFSFFSHFFRQCAWALSVFCLCALAMEWLIPDSVTPYFHLVPFAILALLMLVIDAVFFHEPKVLFERVVLAFGIGAQSLVIFLNYHEPGMANLVAISLLIVMMIVSGAFIFLKDND